MDGNRFRVLRHDGAGRQRHAAAVRRRQPRPRRYTDPDTYNIRRDNISHITFGKGVHYCLGANLARLELRVLFEELLSRFGAVQVVRPVEWARSNRHTGIRHLVVELREDQ